MREERTPEEAILDKALILSLLDRVAHYKDDNVGDKIKCMKLPFLVEYPMFERKLKGFNMTYFRYERGPLSKHVYEAWRDLQATGCLTFDGYSLILTQIGHSLAHEFISDVLKTEENSFFFEQLEGVAKKFGPLPMSLVQRLVYAMDVQPLEGGPRLKVRDADVGTNFTRALEKKEAKQVLKVDQSWLETLAIELNPENKQSINKAIEDFHKGHVLSHGQVWHNVS